MLTQSNDFKIVAKPEGTRCLVLSGKGTTIARDHRGCIVAKFQSGLPGGRLDEGKSELCCVLDCIFNKQTASYFVLDLLQWNDTSYREFPLAVRLIQLEQKLVEFQPILEQISRAQFRLAKYYDCTAEGFVQAYFGPALHPYLKWNQGVVAPDIKALESDLSETYSQVNQQLNKTLTMIEKHFTTLFQSG